MKKYFYAIGAISLLFGACDTAQEPDMVRPASAELRIAGAATMNMVTRADETPTPYEDSFNLHLDGTAEQNSVATYTTAWALTPAMYLTPADRTLVAWAPAALAATDGKIAIKSDVYAVENDLLSYKQENVNSTTPAIDVVFTHAYAKLNIQITAEASYIDAKILASLSVSGVQGSANFNVSNATLSDVTAAAAPVALKTGGTTDFTGVTYSALVVPGATTSLTAACTIDGNDFSAVLDDAKLANLAAGSEYEVTLTLKGKELVLGSVKVQGWTKVDGGSYPLN